MTIRLWDVVSGTCHKVYTLRGPVRGVRWSEGCQQFAAISDPFVEHNSKICIFKCPYNYRTNTTIDDDDSSLLVPILEIDIPKVGGKRTNPTNVQWTAMNESLVVSFDDGKIRFYDPDTGDIMDEIQAHEKKINRMRFNKKKTLFITASADFTSKLYDPYDLQHLKTYKTDRPVNDSVMSEVKDHILLGGGQEAMSVTTTAGKVGKFETRFFHTVYETEFGTVKGHFGPINASKYIFIYY